MAIITFEVDLDDIRGAVHNLTINDSSSPTATQVLDTLITLRLKLMQKQSPQVLQYPGWLILTLLSC